MIDWLQLVRFCKLHVGYERFVILLVVTIRNNVMVSMVSTVEKVIISNPSTVFLCFENLDYFIFHRLSLNSEP